MWWLDVPGWFQPVIVLVIWALIAGALWGGGRGD